MAKLDRLLTEWVDQGLLTTEAAASITAHEASKPRRAWLLYGIFALGATVIAVGIISLIAANWDDIPASVRIGADFLLLGGLAYGAYSFFESGRALLFEATLVLYSFLTLASIGLVSQIYHTGGELYQALLFWAAITFSLTLISKKLLLPFLWTMVWGGAVAATVETVGFFGFDIHDDDALAALFVTAPFICAVIAGALELLGRGEMFRKSFTFFAFGLGLAALATLDVVLSADESLDEAAAAIGPMILLCIIAVLLVAADRTTPRTQKLLLCASLGLLLVASVVGVSGVEAEILGPILSIPTAGCAALYFGVAGQRLLFNGFTILIGVRFLIIYFQALGGLAVTGVGLIVSGALILGLAAAWYKNRDKLQGWVARLAD